MPLNPILIHPAALRLAKPKGYIIDLNSRLTQRQPSFQSDDFKPDHSIYKNAIVTSNGHIYESGAIPYINILSCIKTQKKNNID